MRRALVLCALLVCATLSVTSCDKLKELQQAAENVVKQAAPESNPVKEMLGAYAKGYNEVLNTFNDLIDNYFRSIPADKEPSDELGKIHFFGTANHDMSLKTVKDAFAAASDKAPEKYAHLRPMANDLYATCAELARISGEAKKYYEAEDFKDDAYARGKVLHEEMKTAADKYDAALRQMEAALSTEEDKLMEGELAQYKEEKSYSYYLRYVHFRAKQELAIIDRALREGDAAAIDKAVDDYVAVYNELKAFVDGQASPNAAFKSYVDMVERFVAAAKRLRREAKTEQPDPQKLNREHDSVISAYNTIITVRNSLADLEAYGQLK